MWCGGRLCSSWGPLTEALRTGSPQNETRSGGNLFEKIYADPVRLRGFLTAMTGASMDSAQKIAQNFPWRKYQTFCDIGGAQGCVSVQLALAHKHLTGCEIDLPPVGPIFEDYVKSFSLKKRLKFVGFEAPADSGHITLNGAAAREAMVGDLLTAGVLFPSHGHARGAVTSRNSRRPPRDRRSWLQKTARPNRG